MLGGGRGAIWFDSPLYLNVRSIFSMFLNFNAPLIFKGTNDFKKYKFNDKNYINNENNTYILLRQYPLIPTLK